jgi:hypothetical protein
MGAVNVEMRDALTQLRKAITTLTIELMDCGGTTPRQTYESLREEFPDLCCPFDEGEIIIECKRIQQAEVPKRV